MMASKTEHKRSNRLRASGSEGMRPMNGRRKTLTILVSVAMLLSMLPTNALAEMVGIDGGSAEVVETPTSVIDESGVEAPGADEAPAAGDTDVESEVAQEIAASDGESLVAEAATEDEAAAEGTVADEPRDDATSNDYAEAEPVAGSEAYLSGTLSVEGLDYAVSVDPTEDAKLPANAQLVVSEVSGAAYDEYVAQAESALGKGALSIGRIFDIGFEVEGESVEPASEVSVHIRLANAEEEAAKVLHITDEGVEVIVPDSAPEGSESVDFTVEQLSPFLMQKRNAKGGEQGIITDFNTEVIYGGSWTDGKYVWNAASSASGHHFNFRISFGVDKPAGSEAADIVYPAESIKITVPAQILHADRSHLDIVGHLIGQRTHVQIGPPVFVSFKLHIAFFIQAVKVHFSIEVVAGTLEGEARRKRYADRSIDAVAKGEGLPFRHLGTDKGKLICNVIPGDLRLVQSVFCVQRDVSRQILRTARLGMVNAGDADRGDRYVGGGCGHGGKERKGQA